MSWLAKYSSEQEAVNQMAALTPAEGVPEPGLWQGFGDEFLPGAERALISTGGAIESGFSSLWQSGLEGAASLLLPEPKFGGKVSVTDAEQSSQETLGQGVGEAVIALRADPRTTGMAGQLLNELIAVGAPAVAAAPFGGLAAAAVAVGGSSGYAGKQVAMVEGIDESTATGVGAIEGATNAIGVAIPGARMIPKSVLGDLTAVVGANVGLGVASRAATAKLLDERGYAAQAAKYRAFDGLAMTTDALLGSFFWGLGRATGRASLRQPTESEIDAALTERNAQHYEDVSAPGIPVDAQAANAHLSAMDAAADQLSRGEPVRLPDDLPEASFLRRDDYENPIAAEVAKFDARVNADEFAARVGRAAEYDDAGAPVFRDGTAYPLSEVSRFFDQFVATRQAKDGALMPDVLFQVGRVDDATAQGLRDYLSGFNESLREARISARVIKHIQDSRPSIVRDVLDRLERGVLQADEVLPNQKDPKRVMLVLRDTDAQGSQARHQSTVIELSANGKGVDVVSAMTMPDRTLNKARAYKQELDMSRTGGPLPPSSLGGRETQQPHAAAASEDFLAVERDSAIIDKPAAGTTAADPVVQVADEIMARADDIQLPTGAIDADGNPVTVSAKQMMAEADADIVRADQDSKGFAAAAACFLQRGFK